MIKLTELYKSLALTVLNNTSVITDDKKDIEPDKKEYILEFINEGLTRLHGRFPLKTRNVFVEMREGRTEYPLLARYSFTGFDPTLAQYPYIMDSVSNPFKEDVIKILVVYDSKGHRRGLNDNHNPHGLFTPRPDTLQCIRPRHCEVLTVTYQAKHPTITVDGENQEIDLPDTLLPALKYWVAYSYYTGLNTAESTSKAAEYLQMYESICGEVKDYDLGSSSESSTNTLFEIRGWI
nr:MAG TPA: head to tail adaptor [Caudoviricetes sp.]